MRRTKIAGLLIALVLGGSLLVAPPAQADYHSLCPDPFDALFLTSEPGANLRYRGYVTCAGKPITISSLTVTPAGGATSTFGPLVCTSICDLSGTIPAAPGLYKVTMSFSVGSTTPAPRMAEFLYAGSGQPSRLCPSGLTLNRCA